MPNSYFLYNGMDCRNWNCYKTDPINWPTPARDVEKISVPGRNGDLILDNGKYDNVELIVPCYIKGNYLAMYDAMRAALMADAEYHKFVDSLYPNEYRMVRVTNVEAKVTTRTGGTVEITLDAKPQRFWSGDDSHSYVGQVQPITTYAYTDFTAASQTEITSVARSAGYTDAEITAMRYTVSDISGASVNVGDYVTFAGSGADPFYFINSSHDPLSATSFSGSSGRVRTIYKGTAAQTFNYIVRPYEYGSRILVNDLLQTALGYTQDYIYNQTNYPAKPVIKLEMRKNVINNYVGGIGNCGLYLNIPNPFATAINVLTIDAETLDAYSLPADNDLGYFLNCNAYIRYTGELEIKPGNNEVLTNSLISGMTIIPQWWTL